MSNKTSSTSFKKHGSGKSQKADPLSGELRDAIKHMVANISKSFIVEWYTSISPTNHDFVASCEALIEGALAKLAELCIRKLDKYKVGQLVTSLLHDHILNEKIIEKIKSIERQIDDHEYDICQSSVVRLFGLLCTDELHQVIFTQEFDTLDPSSPLHQYSSSTSSQQLNNDDDSEGYRPSSHPDSAKTTSALYTLVVAMLTKAVFMPIVDSISAPNWLYAVIIWLCKKEEREKAKRQATAASPKRNIINNSNNNSSANSNNTNDNAKSSSTGGSRDRGGQFIHPASSTLCPQSSIKVAATRSYRSLDLEEGIDMASANINFDNPVCDSLKRPLDNIEIYATEEVKSVNSCYVLYCIRYDGLCHRHPSAGFNFIPEHSELPIIDKRATHNSRLVMLDEPNTSGVINYADMSERKSFRRSMTIKRRFREFVILQLRLEENPKIRPYIKNIPKPTKLKAATQNIFSLPGITNIKLDQSTIKLRQRFLERFLIALNNSPFIANSYEFKEFFSYNVNSTATLSKSKSLILQVNLNKVFVDSVRSALSIIRASLPGDDYHLGTNPNPDAWLIELQQSTLKLHVQTRTSHSKMNLERYIDSKLLFMGDSPIRFGKTSSLGRNYERSGVFYQLANSQGGSLRARLVNSHSTSSNTNSSPLLLSRSTSSNSPNVDSSSSSSSNESIYHDASSALTSQQTNEFNSIQICDSVPIAAKLINIIHYSISKNSTSKSYINFMVRLAFGKMIERYAIHLLEAALTLKNTTLCINGITSSIWGESDDPSLDIENASLDEAVLHLTRLLEQNYVNYPFIPKKLLNSLLGQQIEFYLSQLVSQKRNKFIIYSFFVHLLDELEAVEH